MNRNDTRGESPDKVGSQAKATSSKDGDPVAASAFNAHEPAKGGESGGGAYPNPHQGKEEKKDGFLGHGGQTEIGYHGTGQLGDQQTGQGNANAPTKK